MYYKFELEKNFDDEIDQLIESFQTKFWIDEHQWFIRCDYHTKNTINSSLYTSIWI